MQTKKRIIGKNSSKEGLAARISRNNRKVSENPVTSKGNVRDIISSAKKKHNGFLVKEIVDPLPTIDLTSGYISLQGDSSPISSDFDDINILDNDKDSYENVCFLDHLDSIFSPAFCASKNVGKCVTEDVFKKFFENGGDTFEQKPEDYTVEKYKSFENEEDYSTSPCNIGTYIQFENSIDIKEPLDILPGLTADYREDIPHRDPDVYFSIQNYKLECIDDERGKDSISNSDWMEEDDGDDFVEFDPYLFMKNLPELSSIVPCFRRTILPKQTRSCPHISLVLDLDETLVHSSLDPCDDATFTFPVNFNLVEHKVYVKCRPHLEPFLKRVAELFEVIVFTASQSVYAEQLLNVLDPKRKIFRHRVYRDSCVLVEGNYLKDLSILGRDLAHVVIVDNSPQAFGFQVDNGIPIESWFDDETDGELLSLLPFLQSLVGVEDVRPLLVKRFNLRERISSSSSPVL